MGLEMHFFGMRETNDFTAPEAAVPPIGPCMPAGGERPNSPTRRSQSRLAPGLMAGLKLDVQTESESILKTPIFQLF